MGAEITRGDITVGEVISGTLAAREIKAADIAADHIAMLMWNGKTGAESRTWTKHSYSKNYEERWPREKFPHKYEMYEAGGEADTHV